MRCPICSAIVSGGGVCQNCGATLPGRVGEPAGAARRRNGLLSGATKQKRAGTLGDFFRSATGSRAPERDQRDQRDQRKPPGSGQPRREPPPRSVRPARSPATGRRMPERTPPPPSRTPPPPEPAAALDPWASTYDIVPMAVPPPQDVPPASSFAPADDMEEWNDEPGWGSAAPPAVAPASSAPYDLYGAPPDDWQQAADPAMRDMFWGADPYASPSPPRRSPARTRPTIGGISRLTMNMTMFGLVLLILGIAILVGMRYVQSTQREAAQTPQPTPTVAPTAAPAAGFSSLQAKLYSVAYPAQWLHKSTGDPLGCGCSLSGESFSDGSSTTFVIYTRLAAPADQLAQVLTQSAASVSPNQTPQVLQINQQRTLDGASWVENDYTITKVTGSTAVQLQVRVLVVNFNATTYIVVASAPQSSFAHINSSYFEPMLRSFRFD